jgi:4-hydroxy-3-methylbut-2-enyl diphosphate reductase
MSKPALELDATSAFAPALTGVPPPEELILARPRGFCAGVVRAIEMVERALRKYGPPVYVKHAIVHNRVVVERLERMGARFVEELDEVPAGAITIFSAHGVSPAVHAEAAERGLDVLDATCPLVTKVHMEARRYAREEVTIFLIGHRDHVEVQGTLGEAPERTVVIETIAQAERVRVADPERVAYLTQTTLSLDDTAAIVGVLKRRFPALRRPRKEDICYATQNRQQAVKALADQADVILVIGSHSSSNSNRLVEVARSRGVPAHLVDSAEHVNPAWLAGARRIGITAGASAPEEVIRDLVERLSRRYGAPLRELEVIEEHTTFPLPVRLQD